MNFNSKLKVGMNCFCQQAVKNKVPGYNILENCKDSQGGYSICFPMSVYFVVNFPVFKSTAVTKTARDAGLDFIENKWYNCMISTAPKVSPKPDLTSFANAIKTFYSTKGIENIDLAKQFCKNSFNLDFNIREEHISETSTDIINDVSSGSFYLSKFSFVGFKFNMGTQTVAHVMILVRYNSNVYLIDPATGAYQIIFDLGDKTDEYSICNKSVEFFLNKVSPKPPTCTVDILRFAMN